MLLIAEVLVSIIVIVYCWFKWSYESFKKRGIPYVEPTFPFGSSNNMLTRKEHIGFVLSNFYKKFKQQGHKIGAIFVFRKPAFIVRHPDIIRNILLKDFQYFTDRPNHVNEKNNPVSGHLINLRGSKWKNMRAKLTPTFTSGKMKMMYPLLVECCEQLLAALHDVAATKEPVDIKDEFARFTTDVIGTCAFGLDCNSIADGNSKFRTIGKSFFASSVKRRIKSDIIRNFPKFADFFDINLFRKQVEGFFIKIVDDAVRYRKSNNVVRKDFLQLLIDIQDKEGLTFEQVCAQSYVFFLAGFETSSTLATFCLYELAKNQDIQQKAREEVQHVMAKNGRRLSYDDLQELKYLDCVLDEALRKHPPVLVLVRTCTNDWTEPESGIVVKVGETIMVPVHGLHHDPEYFPDPENFNPDRFNAENKQKIVPYSYLPFGEGPRNCIGLRFGYMQSKVGVAMLLDKFKFTLSKGTKDPFVPDPNTFIHSAKDTIYLDIEAC